MEEEDRRLLVLAIMQIVYILICLYQIREQRRAEKRARAQYLIITFDGDCLICYEPMTEGVNVHGVASGPRRNHAFHLSCIEEWTARQRSCPVCREVI